MLNDNIIQRMIDFNRKYGFWQLGRAIISKFMKISKLEIIKYLFIHRLQDRQLKKYINKDIKNLILVLIPSDNYISGGIMSIFSIAKYSREFFKIHKSEVILATIHLRNDIYYDEKGNPIVNIIVEDHRASFYKQSHFKNDEKIYRISQIEKFKELENLLIFIPEYATKNFYEILSPSLKHFLTRIPNIKINILNQHIDLMPHVSEIKDLYRISHNISQTCAHPSYVNQQIANEYQLPTLYLSAYFEEFFRLINKTSFNEKKDIIAYSPDENQYKSIILKKLKHDLPQFKFIEIRGISFVKYMTLISTAKFVITFGEGMDGYLVQPFFQGGISFAVYNKEFFPSESYQNYFNIFSSYEDMQDNLSGMIKDLNNNPEKYNQLSQYFFEKIDSVSDVEQFRKTLERFYLNDFDYYPESTEGI